MAATGSRAASISRMVATWSTTFVPGLVTGRPCSHSSASRSSFVIGSPHDPERSRLLVGRQVAWQFCVAGRLAPPINLAAGQLGASQINARLATVAGQTLHGARVPFWSVTLVEEIVTHPALDAGIGDGEPSLLAADRAAEAFGAIVHVVQLVRPELEQGESPADVAAQVKRPEGLAQRSEAEGRAGEAVDHRVTLIERRRLSLESSTDSKCDVRARCTACTMAPPLFPKRTLLGSPLPPRLPDGKPLSGRMRRQAVACFYPRRGATCWRYDAQRH